MKIKETVNKTITIKDAYMDGTTLLEEDATPVDIYDVLQNTYGNGTQFTIKVTTKVDRDLNE